MAEALRDVDANLLLSLHALLEERNLTHAGARLSMSQPAMSGALARLRRHFGDELLVRNGRGFSLTPLAEALRPQVARSVDAAEALLGAQRAFNAAQSTKRFQVSMSEYAMTVLARRLTHLLAGAAPGCSVSFDALPGSRERFGSRLTRRDLIIGPLGFDLPGKTQPIFTDRLVCLVSGGNARLRDGRLTLDDLRELPHAVADLGAADETRRPLEAALKGQGVGDRNVLVRVPSLLTLPFAIAGTELCAFVPTRLAARCLDMLDLRVARTPLPTIGITEAAHWHPGRDQDPSGVWLRRLLHDVALEIEDGEEPDL